jgi:hypothetical protein
VVNAAEVDQPADDRDELDIRTRAAEALDGRDEALADIARRQAARTEGRAQEWRLSKPAARPYEPARARDWTAEQRWIEAIIDQHVGPGLAGLRKEMGDLADEAGGEVATQRAKVATLEARIRDLELRLARLRPRSVRSHGCCLVLPDSRDAALSAEVASVVAALVGGHERGDAPAIAAELARLLKAIAAYRAADDPDSQPPALVH